MIADLCKVDIVITHSPEGVRCGKDNQLIYLRTGFPDDLYWTNWNGSDQAARLELSDGLGGCEERGAGGDAVIHKDDDAVGERGEVPALAIEALPSSDLLLLHLNGHLDIGS